MIQNKAKRKLLGIRNGLKIYSKLSAKVQLKAHKSMHKISGKQRAIIELWRKITNEKFEAVGRKCLWCGKPALRAEIDGHHQIPRRYGIHTSENCYPVHRQCHNFITDKSINTLKYPTRQDWEKRPC